VLSWSLVEIPRYAYYAVNLIAPTSIPYFLTFLRYSLFMVLYPSGISGKSVSRACGQAIDGWMDG
jgi:very-long-chain (3R)-3-hydroxyacyl-CoA dehydratase